jgi:hypothetical protein
MKECLFCDEHFCVDCLDDASTDDVLVRLSSAAEFEARLAQSLEVDAKTRNAVGEDRRHP